MSEETVLNKWFSTYGMITTERILGKYQISLPSDKLLTALKTPHSFYHKLLIVPTKNVLNGIVFQQAHDYHVYAQKLFIDYLISGEHSKEEEAQGAASREDLENERKKLITLGEEFHEKEIEYYNLIADSQNLLMKASREFNAAFEKSITAVTSSLKKAGYSEEKAVIRGAITNTLIFCELNHSNSKEQGVSLFIEKLSGFFKNPLKEEAKEQIRNDLFELVSTVIDFEEKVTSFINQTEEMSVEANSYRAQFYQAIIRAMELIKLLPEYKIDPLQDEINREALYFDKSIGAI
jgi:hypothetical protein